MVLFGRALVGTLVPTAYGLMRVGRVPHDPRHQLVVDSAAELSPAAPLLAREGNNLPRRPTVQHEVVTRDAAQHDARREGALLERAEPAEPADPADSHGSAIRDALWALGGSSGLHEATLAKPLTDMSPGTLEFHQRLRTEVQLEDTAGLYILLGIFVVICVLGWAVAYRLSEPTPEVVYFSEATTSEGGARPALLYGAKNADGFLTTFNRAPPTLLLITGYKPADAPSRGWHAVVRWRKSKWKTVFHVGIDLSSQLRAVTADEARRLSVSAGGAGLTPPGTESDESERAIRRRQCTTLSKRDTQRVAEFLRTSDPLAFLTIEKTVQLAGLETLAVNIKRKIRSLGTEATHISVRLSEPETLKVYQNNQLGNFLAHPTARALFCLSCVGPLLAWPALAIKSAMPRNAKLTTNWVCHTKAADLWTVIEPHLSAHGLTAAA